MKKSLDPGLAVYQTIFGYLGRVYLEIPDAGFIDGIVKGGLFFQWPLVSDEPDVDAGVRLMQTFSKQWSPSRVSLLVTDYTRLFTGFETTLAPPYESVYLSQYHIMFERQTLEVRRFYEEFGLQAAKKMKEPDDHIGLELLFIAHLCGLAAGDGQEKRSNRGREILEELRRFLDDHLLRWLFLFLERVERHSQTDYYRAAAYITRGMVKDLSGFLLPGNSAESQGNGDADGQGQNPDTGGSG